MGIVDKHTLLRGLLLTRLFEERCIEVYEDTGIPETIHSSLGQEAVGVGACLAVEERDYISPSLRTRAAMLLRVPLREVVAGMFGTQSGPSSGRTTQHHMGSTDAGILGTTGLIGSHLNASVGAGLGSAMLGEDRVTLVFFGDGASTRGELHSALNFATVRDAPVVFIIENNQYTELTPISELVAVEDLAAFGSQGLPTEIVDGQDVLAVHETTHEAVDRARAGDGPTLIEAKTLRFRPHAESVPDTREQAEIDALQDRDPVEQFVEHLLEEAIVSETEIEEMKTELRADIDDAFEFVETDPLPDEEVMYQVYSDVDVTRDGVVRR
ncbi:MAG: thiamine pyrophosphate-dependent dehydrogenase E1 component subunit alpha [Halobacteriales archaeon]|nr:thiamine pyrophosphate-dependent dehydrogenase E1 component subunit alpha [Halobacteriales archaeon]